MRKIIIFLGICFSSGLYGQFDSTLAKTGKLDFAIPEHPAFSILDNNPDNILRPGNTQEIVSYIYSNFLSGKTAIVPKGFSLEFSPAQLIGINKITFEDYKKNGKRILYDTKISIGAKTSNGEKELKNFAAGIRFTWVDNSSLAANKEFVDSVCKGLIVDAKTEHSFILYLINEGHLYNGKRFTEDEVAENVSLRNYVHNLYLAQPSNSKYAKFFSVKSLREIYKNKNWNKFKFETALAVKFNSNDSLVANSHYSKFELYNTVAFPLGKSGQGLIGLNYSDNLLDSIQHTINDLVQYHVSIITLASRIYIGTNAFKSFIEGSGKLSSDKKLKLGLNVGAEINVTDGIWAILNFGNNWLKSTDSNISDRKWINNWYWGFDLRFKIPEKMRI